jgi:hypothetical protein
MKPGQILKQYRDELVFYDHAAEYLAKCEHVDEVKEIRDKARAATIYAAQAKNHEMEFRAARIRLRAERRCGELLKQMRQDGTRHSGHGDQTAESPDGTPLPTLADFGISKRQASDWQQIADIPQEEFEKFLQSAVPSTAKLLRLSLMELVEPVCSDEPVPIKSEKWWYHEVDKLNGEFIAPDDEEERQHCKDMPNVLYEGVKPFARIVMQFLTLEDLHEFSQLIGQNCTVSTRKLWFPHRQVIIVRFGSQQALDDFSRVVGHKFTEKTPKELWFSPYPGGPFDSVLAYVNEAEN